MYYISYFIKIVFKKPGLAFQELVHYFVINRLFHKKYNVCVTINGYLFTIPNEHQIFYTLHEVFTWKLYKKLIGCNHVLDLGGFIGDSGVRLSQHNDNVTIYEPNPRNFEYIIKNTNTIDNIITFNGAVVGLKQASLFYEGGNFNAGGKITTNKTEIPIVSYAIESVLKSNSFDGLKMDIEGAEYEIIKKILSKDLFHFKKGYIEFHYYVNNKDNQKTINSLYDYLYINNYIASFEDVFGNNIDKKDIFILDPQIFVLYFEQNA